MNAKKIAKRLMENATMENEEEFFNIPDGYEVVNQTKGRLE